MGSVRDRRFPPCQCVAGAPESQAATALLVSPCTSIAMSNRKLCEPAAQLPDDAAATSASPRRDDQLVERLVLAQQVARPTLDNPGQEGLRHFFAQAHRTGMA